MTLEEFKSSIKENKPPDLLEPLLKALWHDAKGNWKSAHEIAQEISTYDGSWVHAYLHRKEGDLSNASYWYSRAGRSMPGISLESEWEIIVKELLSNS